MEEVRDVADQHAHEYPDERQQERRDERPDERGLERPGGLGDVPGRPVEGGDGGPVVVDPWAGVDVGVLAPELARAAVGYMAALETMSRVVAAREVDGAAARVLAALLSAGAGRSSAVGACVLSVVEADGVWAAGGTGSFAHWVASAHTVGVQAARGQVRLGRALRDHLPLTAAAVAAGSVTVEHARILAQLGPTTELRRAVLGDPGHPCNEAFLVGLAQRFGVDRWRWVVRRWAAAADPDADDRGYVQACDRQHLQLVRLGDMYDVSGTLTVETGQVLAAALAAFTPAPAADDDRTPGQRRAHAVGDLARVGACPLVCVSAWPVFMVSGPVQASGEHQVELVQGGAPAAGGQ